MVNRLTVGSCGTVLVLGLLVAGCTPDPGTTPSVTPTPAVSSPTPSPSPTPTPTENAQERQQRLDFEAAEKAYLTASDETETAWLPRAAHPKPTRLLTENAVGAYLDVQMEDLRTLKETDGARTAPLLSRWLRLAVGVRENSR